MGRLTASATNSSPAIGNNDDLIVRLNRIPAVLAIALVSVASLFLEMLLIRWISTEVRIFAYLQNTVLVVCILGLGMGCFTCRQTVRLRHLLAPILALVALLAWPTTRQLAASISERLAAFDDLLVWHTLAVANGWEVAANLSIGLGMTMVLMVLLWETFVPLGRVLGRLMDDHPHTIRAYSANVLGSLVGIWLFAGLSALYAPPWVWFAVVAGLLALVAGRGRERVVGLAGCVLMVGLAWYAGRDPRAIDVAWSPYQKLAARVNDRPADWTCDYLVTVNNTGYQGMLDLSTNNVAAKKLIPTDDQGYGQYDLPTCFQPRPKNVLIVGAGSGNDVAGVLRGGAERVTAVEIDPAIIEFGRRLHPEQPYSSDRVTVVNDDARSFFATTDEKFDLIVFGLLDSHTTTALTNARLDHYVYTRESLAHARSLLTPGGVMLLSFEATRPFVARRMERCLAEVFEHEPLQFRLARAPTGWGGTVFVCGADLVVQQALATNRGLARHIADWQAANPTDNGTADVELATDDWPYIYLEYRRIPTLYYLLAALLVTLLWYCKRRLHTDNLGLSAGRANWHFFFLGAAFMLLETHSISKASVVLGNTWLVNAVIISGILVMILAANWVAARWSQIPQRIVMAGLIGSCLTLACVDLSQFAFLPYATKAALVGLCCAGPMFFSGLVFVDSFRSVTAKDQALGANLFGALIGGLLQSLTFGTGLNALMLVVAALYGAALAVRPHAATKTPANREQSARNTSSTSGQAMTESLDSPELVSV